VNYIDEPTKFDAIRSLRPNARFSLRNDEITIWQTDDSIPTEEEINAKIQELEIAEPMRLLRQERDRRLAETDWWAIRSISEKPMTYQQKDYRQRLRDLPSIANPRINEIGELYNFEWPIKPE